MLVAILIFAATLALVIWQPRGLGIGWSALLGAAVALLTGVVSMDDVPVVWGIVWDATFTFIALIVISLILDAAGFFEWAALHVARWGRGYGHWLFLLIVLLTAVVAAIFANDGAVLILTPLVLEMLHALRFRPAAALAFVFASGFMADAASLPLMISNLTNIIVANYFGISFADYAAVMVPVNVMAVLASLAVLWLFFRKDLPPRFEVSALPEPAGAIRDPFVFKAGWLVLALLMAGYFAAHPLGLPVSAVAGSAALLLVLAALREHFIRKQPQAVIPVMTLLREAPWQIVLFSLGMYLVVFGLRNQGFTAELGGYPGMAGWPGFLAGHSGCGIPVRPSVGRDEQPADGDGGQPGHPRRPSFRADAGGDGVCQRDRLQPGAEDDPAGQPRHAAVAARAGSARHPDRLGRVLPRWGDADPAGAAFYLVGTGRLAYDSAMKAILKDVL